MRRTATALAKQMTEAGITPENVTTNPAYLMSGNQPFLRYAMDGNRRPILGQSACTLWGDDGDWLLWDAHGSKNVRIVYLTGIGWSVANVGD